MLIQPFSKDDYDCLAAPLNVASNLALGAGLCAGTATITFVALQALDLQAPLCFLAASVPFGGAVMLSVGSIAVITAVVVVALTIGKIVLSVLSTLFGHPNPDSSKCH